MSIKFKDIVDAFDSISFGSVYEYQALLNKETGKIYWDPGFGDDDEELPEDMDDDKYVGIPHKNELDLGKPLVQDSATCEY